VNRLPSGSTSRWTPLSSANGRTTYTQYETEKSEPALDTVSRLSEHFNVSIDYLLGKTTIKAPIETIAAHHEGDEWTEDELEDIENFKDFVRMKREKK